MARVIETTTTPLPDADVDPVTLDLIENGLRNARYEMDEVLFRTALSPGIREQHDEFPLIADPSGKMVVGQFGLSIPDFLDGFDGDIEEGDVLLTSDPYACGAAISHANDWLVVTPIFVEGRLVGWASMFGHMSDVGGKTPSSMPTDAKTIYEEGVVIPPFKLYSAGTVNDDALRIILNQVRVPDWNRADLNGLVAACRTAGRRVQEMCARFGTEEYVSALDALLQRNYAAMKVLLGVVFEEGRTLSFTDYICDDGVGYGPYELKMSLTRTGDKVHLDFTGSSPQAKGPINYYINENLVRMFFGIYMITVADPQILWNDGFYPLVAVEIPDDSFWKPQYPAGLHRGGNGVDVAYRFLEAGTIAIHDDRWLTYPWGVNGGEPGARGRKWLERADGTTEVLGSKVHDVPVERGDLLHFVTWGGGGWGDPLAREPDLVGLEVRRGLVTADGARRYGVVCDESGVVDVSATETLRSTLDADRPHPLPTFDMGPPLETILERALEETGLPAPRPPVPR